MSGGDRSDDRGHGVGTPVIAGNWKMNHGPAAARDFVLSLRRHVPPEGLERVVLFPPFLSLAAAREVAVAADTAGGGAGIALGVQNIHWEESGAYTGETSAAMAREAGATFVLVGHSERRHIFGESEEDTARKVAAARRAGLVPVLCVGETLEERRAGRLEDVILRQLDAGLGVSGGAGGPGPLLLAYEPVWAIGTGETATPDDASAAHALLREALGARYGSAVDAIPILYGGSVKPDNASDLLRAEHVGGVLVGGASLDPGSFASIIAAAPEGRPRGSPGK